MLYTCDPSITAAFLKPHWTMLGVYQYLVYWYMCCVHIWTSLYFSIFEKVSAFISEISLCNVVLVLQWPTAVTVCTLCSLCVWSLLQIVEVCAGVEMNEWFCIYESMEKNLYYK